MLYLDFIGCTLLSDQSIQALAHHMPPMLEELQLHVAGCEAIGTQGVQQLGGPKTPQNASKCPVFQSFDLFLTVFGPFFSLRELKSSCPSSLQQFRGTFKGTALNRKLGKS